MNIRQYVASLLPSFDRSQVSEDIRILKEELVSNTLPPFQAAADHYARESFQAKDVKDFDALFGRHVRTDIRGNWIQVTHEALSRSSEVLDQLNTMVDKEFARDITADGMTYLRVNILRYLEVESFALRYARTVLLWAYAQEHSATIRNAPENPVSKAEMSWLLKNRDYFFQAIRVLSTPAKEAKKFFQNIPNMIVTPEEDVVSQTAGARTLDPLQMNLLPPKLNPIYHVRMAIAEWQVSRYKAAEVEAQALEYRLFALKELKAEGQTDAKLEQNIEYTESRLKKLKYKMVQLADEE